MRDWPPVAGAGVSAATTAALPASCDRHRQTMIPRAPRTPCTSWARGLHLIAVAMFSVGCGAARDATSSAGPDDAGLADADDPDPDISTAEWAALLALSPTPLPASPPDVTNRFADSAAAAALGQRLFFDPSFSGPLLDSDNDGSSSALGTRGQTGRVACAGCHIPKSGF